MEAQEYIRMFQVEESHWYFRGKRTILERLLTQYVEPRVNYRVLDIGCGTGATLQMLDRWGRAMGLDRSPLALRLCRQRNSLRPLVLADVEDPLPFEDDCFDIICALDVLEHLRDERPLVNEMWRVSRPHATVFITVPALSALWSVHDEALHHHRRYTKRQLLAVFTRERWSILKISYYNFFLFPVVFLYRRLPRSGPPRSDTDVSLPPWLHRGLLRILVTESRLLTRVNLPIGVSIVCIVRPQGKSPIGTLDVNERSQNSGLDTPPATDILHSVGKLDSDGTAPASLDA